jgi:hypothetical protein
VSGVRLINDEQEIIDVQTKSIIVATGGFSANSAMVVKYRPDLEGFVTTNHKGAPVAVSRCWNALVPAPWTWAKFKFTRPSSSRPRT